MELYKHYKIASLPDFFIKELTRLAPEIDPELGFQSKKYGKGLSSEFKSSLKLFLEKHLDREVLISEGWLNYIKKNKLMNGLDWHNEVGVGANKENVTNDPYICIMWISGGINQGGDFKYIHHETNEITIVPFNPPSFMVMYNDTIHAVDHYSGNSHRISLNLNFR